MKLKRLLTSDEAIYDFLSVLLLCLHKRISRGYQVYIVHPNLELHFAIYIMQTSKINHFELSREYLNIERYLTLQISLSSTWYKYPIEKFSICVNFFITIECQLEYQAFIWNVKHSIIVEVSISFVCFIVSAESVCIFIG